MEMPDNYDRSGKVTMGIVIGVIDILAMVVAITILCRADFRF